MSAPNLEGFELSPAELTALENTVRDRENYRRRDGSWRSAYEETDLIENALRKLRMRARLRHGSALNLEIKGP